VQLLCLGCPLPRFRSRRPAASFEARPVF